MKDYDCSKSKFIKYLDTNNLYGNFDVNSIGENSFDRYILEVGLEYPNEWHVLHNDYPLAQRKLELIMICCQNIVVTLLKNME